MPRDANIANAGEGRRIARVDTIDRSTTQHIFILITLLTIDFVMILLLQVSL